MPAVGGHQNFMAGLIGDKLARSQQNQASKPQAAAPAQSGAISSQIGKALMFKMGINAKKHADHDSDEDSNKSVKYAKNSGDRNYNDVNNGTQSSDSEAF